MSKFRLKMKYRKYMCLTCGNIQNIQTNHTASVVNYCTSCSWKPSWTGIGYIHTQFGGLPTLRKFVYFNKSKKELIKENESKNPNTFGG